MEALDREKSLVYEAATELIKIKGLDSFIEYLQEVDETGVVPKSCPLDKETYVAILRQAINDCRKKLFNQ